MTKIKLTEYNAMIWFLLRSSLIGTGVAILLSTARQDIYISGIIALFLGLIPIMLFNKLKKVDSSKNIIKLNTDFLGSFGYVLNIFMMIAVFAFIFLIFWNLTNFISTEFLYKTPRFFISICFLLPVLYAAFKDFHVVTKASLISFYFIIGFVIFIILGLIKELDFGNLMPIMQTEPGNILKASFIMIVYNVLPIALLLIIPENALEKDSGKSTIIFYIVTFIFIINIFLFIVSCFSIELSLLYDYTEFHIFKRLSIGTFIDKIESFLSIEWILGMILSIIIGIHYLKKSYMQMMKKDKKHGNIFCVITCIILIILVNYSFKNLIQIQSFVANYLVYLLLFGFFICPLITYIFTRKKRLHESLVN